MTYKKKISTIFSITFVILCISIIISELDFTHCNSQGYCVDSIGNIFGQGVGFLSSSALLPLLLLIFTKEAVFKTWKKFAIKFLLFALIWIILAPSSSGGPFKIPLDSKESASMIFSTLFLITSLLIIIIKSIKLAEKPKQAESEKSRQLPWR